MSDFDPYYKWLGIPPEEQPPTHYRLLGIQLLEQNAEVIEAAANRQMAYLQELSAGDDHIDEAQRLLGEVARARVCLLAAESKARYDAEIASTLDSLPEAKEESADAQQPLAGSIETITSGGSRRAAAAKGRKKSSSRRTKRSTPSKSGSSSGNKSSSLQVKIIAAAVPAVLGLIVLIVLLSTGGGKNKANNTSNPETAGRSSQSDAGKGVPKSTEAEKKKADRDLEKQLARLENQRPKPPEPKPDKPKAPETKSTPPESAGADAVDVEGSGLSETEQAEALLNARGLEEGFNSQWELAELTKAYEETKNASGNQSDSGNEADFQTELVRQTRQYFNALKEFYKQTNYQQHPASDPTAREAAGYLNSVGTRPFPENTEILQFALEGGAPVQFQVPSDIQPISLTDKVQREVSTQPSSNPASNEAINEIAGLLRDGYQKLSQDAEVQAALKTVEGSLAESPGTANVTQAETRPPAKNPVVPAKTPEQAAVIKDGAAGSDVENNANDQNQSGGESEEPTVGFDQLKEKLTTLEKETKKTLGEFNKEAKNYISQKKNLVKRIKAGEALYVNRGRQQDAIQYPEEKAKFGEETDKLVTKPLNTLKAQLQKLTKPDTAELEEKLKQAEKLIEQLKATSEYAANPKSIDSLAEKIAKYRKGYEVQQTKMSK